MEEGLGQTMNVGQKSRTLVQLAECRRRFGDKEPVVHRLIHRKCAWANASEIIGGWLDKFKTAEVSYRLALLRSVVVGVGAI
jgi:hypothetical protein